MSEQNNAQRVSDILKEYGVFYYATVDGGSARVRPFGFQMVYEDKLYFGMGTHKQSYQQTLDNPNFEICACKPPKWIRIRGKAVLDMRPEVQEHMYEKSPFLKKAYNEETGLVHATFYIEDGHCELASMDGSFEEFDF